MAEMQSVLAIVLLVTAAAVVVQARSVKWLPQTHPRDVLLEHWKSLRKAASARSERDACSDAQEKASGEKFGTCEQIIAKALTNQPMQNSDVQTYCKTDLCSSYLYETEKSIIDNCPDLPGVSITNKSIF